MKKVLISEQDIIALHGMLNITDSAELLQSIKGKNISFYEGRLFLDGYTKFGSDLLKWFDDQPDISVVIANSVKEGLKNAKESFIKEVLSKIQTTGGKDEIR